MPNEYNMQKQAKLSNVLFGDTFLGYGNKTRRVVSSKAEGKSMGMSRTRVTSKALVVFLFLFKLGTGYILLL